MPPKHHQARKTAPKFKIPPGVTPFPGQWLEERKPNADRSASELTKHEAVTAQLAAGILSRKGKLSTSDLNHAKFCATKLLLNK